MISIVTTVVVPHLYMPQNNSETIKQNDDLENKLKASLFIHITTTTTTKKKTICWEK